jgi:hypothetical protein
LAPSDVWPGRHPKLPHSFSLQQTTLKQGWTVQQSSYKSYKVYRAP